MVYLGVAASAHAAKIREQSGPGRGNEPRQFYPGVFAGARQLAVEQQSTQIARNVYPEPAEVEAFEQAAGRLQSSTRSKAG